MSKLKNYIQHLILLFAIAFPQSFYAQDNTLSYSEFIAIVKEHHPIAFQSGLVYEKGKAYLQKARGAFDPKINAGLDQKNLKNTLYYSHLHTGLKVPTWYGITVNADYDNNRGTYLSSELINGPQGIFAGGVSITLGKGLFIDERRAELKQAKVYLNSSQLEQKIILNQLLYNASVNYWYWQKYYQEKMVYKQALDNAYIRFLGVKQSVELGDKPAIDSVEAKTFYQNQQINYEEAKNNFINYGLKLSVYLWQDGMIPLEIDTTLLPDLTNNFLLIDTVQNIDTIIENHPEVLLYDNKVEVQNIERRLMAENLKPTLNLKYNLLSEIDNSSLSDFDINNNKFGAYFSYPIFIRKERANLKLSQLKVQEIKADRELKKANLKYKIRAAINNTDNLYKQYSISEEATENFEKLVSAEQILFNTGESSIFLINYREQSLIKAKLKMINLSAKQKAAKQEVDFLLFNQF